jgi:hypothetical protein
MNVRYRVELSQAEREELTAILSGGKRSDARSEPRLIPLNGWVASADAAAFRWACSGVSAREEVATRTRASTKSGASRDVTAEREIDEDER